MTHVTSGRLARLSARLTARFAISGEYATWHGWQTQRAGLAGIRCRDPRFDQLKAHRVVPAGRRS